ncbi:MAG: hypothetical protein ACR2LQ_14310 [Acidimicrobiales bacterium]
MRRHHHVEDQPATVDPLAAAVWRHGLTKASAAPALVIHAPHASELAAPAPALDAHRDAA